MWYKKLKKKKLQSILIISLLFLTSLIFASSLSMITSINGYVNKYYSNEKFYDLIVYNSDVNATGTLIEWCKNNSKVNDIKVMDSFTSGNDLYTGRKNMKLARYSVVPLEDMNKVPYGLNRIAPSDKAVCPKEGEIWINQLTAANYNLKVGDILTFHMQDKNIKLKISSLINDSLQPSSLMSIINFYINRENIRDFNSFTNQPLVLIDAKKGANLANLLKDLTDKVNPKGFIFHKYVLAQSATTASSILGGICTLASLLLFIVSILLIRFILWNSILKEYKSIGIYKALGFSKREINGFYLKGYALTALTGSILGAFCCIPVLNYTASKVLKYVGCFKGASINYTVILLTILLFSLVFIINLYIVIRRTNKISPVAALRTGITSSRKKLTKSLVKNTTSPFALAINDILKYKKNSIYLTISIALPLTLVLFFGNFNITILKMKDNSNIWFGLPKSNITVNASFTSPAGALKNVLNKISKDPRVKNYVYGSFSYMGAKLDTKKYPLKAALDSTLVMNSYEKAFGFTIIDGHNPRKYNELVVSTKILNDTGLSVGDYIELSLNEKKDTYLISGSYNSLMNGGYGIRLLSTALQKVIPDFLGSEIFINLKDLSKRESFEKEINKEFPSLQANDVHPMLKYTIDSIPGLLLPVSSMLIIVFIAFSFITVLNIIIMNIRDNRKNLGIMKALGFTTVSIGARYLCRMLLLTVTSTIISVLLNLTIARPLITLVMNGMDVLILSPITMVSLITVTILMVITITLACCKSIKNTKPTELIEE